MYLVSTVMKERLTDQIGKPYVLGANGPSNFDCSGLLYWALRSFGLHNPDMTAQQYADLTAKPPVGEWKEEECVIRLAFLKRKSDGVVTHVAEHLIGQVWISSIEGRGVVPHTLASAYTGPNYEWFMHYMDIKDMFLRYW